MMIRTLHEVCSHFVSTIFSSAALPRKLTEKPHLSTFRDRRFTATVVGVVVLKRQHYSQLYLFFVAFCASLERKSRNQRHERHNLHAHMPPHITWRRAGLGGRAQKQNASFVVSNAETALLTLDTRLPLPVVCLSVCMYVCLSVSFVLNETRRTWKRNMEWKRNQSWTTRYVMCACILCIHVLPLSDSRLGGSCPTPPCASRSRCCPSSNKKTQTMVLTNL